MVLSRSFHVRARFAGFGTIVLACVAILGCSGARHRKVAGPPPEYELPEDLDASAPPATSPARPSDAAAAQ